MLLFLIDAILQWQNICANSEWFRLERLSCSRPTCFANMYSYHRNTSKVIWISMHLSPLQFFVIDESGPSITKYYILKKHRVYSSLSTLRQNLLSVVDKISLFYDKRSR